jgi:hypothetical protein
MPDYVIDSFVGVDRRRLQVAALPGTLWDCEECFLNNGGEIEKRKKFVSHKTLPSGTFGFAEADGNLYVFGSGTDPGVPSGVTYQRLQHPSGSAMTAVYDAELFDGKLYVTAGFADGSIYHFYNGSRVTDWFDGKARTSFEITGGTSNPGTNKVTSITVDGVEILNTAVDWTTSNAATATAVASQIDSYNSTPEYTAVSSGNTVTIIASTAGTGPNGFLVSVTVGGDVTTTAPAALANGVADAPGEPGKAVKTIKDKMYTTADTANGDNIHHSAFRDATEYTPGTAVGSGFFKPSAHSSSAQDLIGLGAWLNNLVVMAKKALQVWFVDIDETLNAHQQTLSNTGTEARKSIAEMNNGDLAFLSPRGVRTLRAREAVTDGYVFPLGAPIDTLVLAHRAGITIAEWEAAVSVVEPRSGQLWMAIEDKIFIYADHPEQGVTGWSTFDVGFQITEFVVVGLSLYARSGDTIYVYGGTGFGTYEDDDAMTAKVRIPYLDAGRPSTYKEFTGLDMAGEGEWTIKVNTNLEDPTELETVAITKDTTFSDQQIPTGQRDAQFAIELTNTKTGAAKISRFVMHYDIDVAG